MPAPAAITSASAAATAAAARSNAASTDMARLAVGQAFEPDASVLSRQAFEPDLQVSPSHSTEGARPGRAEANLFPWGRQEPPSGTAATLFREALGPCEQNM